jgi:hypothetical protein
MGDQNPLPFAMHLPNNNGAKANKGFVRVHQETYLEASITARFPRVSILGTSTMEPRSTTDVRRRRRRRGV